LTTNGARDLAPRLHALERAVESSRGMMPHAVVDRAAGVRANAGDRLARGDAAVVVALAGGTGSGKSSLFNAVAKADIADVGVRRPTTTDPVALVIGDIEGSDSLLDWLEVRKRFTPEKPTGVNGGLILLDLPDHDSIRIDHKATVDRVIQRVDVLLWVLDPQKYAQGLLHRGYLRDLRQHADVQLVALNKVDELSNGEQDACVTDLRRILASEGLSKVPVYPISALDGTGLGTLREALSALAFRRTAALQRIDGDLRKAADDLAAHLGLPPERPLDPDPLVEVVAAAARVDDRAAAEGERYTVLARRRTRPPLLRGVSSVFQRRERTRSFAVEDFDPEARDPSPVAVQHALHELAVGYGRGLTRPWRSRLREVALHASEPLQRLTSQALARVTASPPRRVWWRPVSLLWGVFELLAVAGLVWLAVIAATNYLALPMGDPPTVGGVSLPIVVVAGGVLGWVICRIARERLISVGARRHAQALRRSYHGEIAEAVKEAIAPLAVEIATYRRLVKDLRAVVG
jgi:GTP-binding protein EngB required for normal cell division